MKSCPYDFGEEFENGWNVGYIDAKIEEPFISGRHIIIVAEALVLGLLIGVFL